MMHVDLVTRGLFTKTYLIYVLTYLFNLLHVIA